MVQPARVHLGLPIQAQERMLYSGPVTEALLAESEPVMMTVTVTATVTAPKLLAVPGLSGFAALSVLARTQALHKTMNLLWLDQ